MDDDKTRTYKVLSAGTRVSHYEISKRIGAGGMGEVYLAEDTSLHRKVALKFLPARWSTDEELRKRFAREAEAAAQLNHPNIITIHEIGQHEERPYFAMELVEGQSLKEFAASGQTTIEQVIELAIQILDGLKLAHDKGITHRDIKPSNILMDSFGRPKILDFGLAAVKGSEELTRTGSTFGTVQYMSPEQTLGNHVDQRSDLFSFGVVLYELITGKNPFVRENDMATGQAILSATPDPLARFRSGIPPELEAIVTKLLEKDPQLRYQTAADVIADFRRLAQAAGVVISSRPFIAHRRKRRYWVPASLAVVAVAAILVLGPWKFEMSSSDDAFAAGNRIAIMYFDNLLDPADAARLGEIITTLLNTDLSESEYVNVMSSQRLYDILKQLGREGQKKLDREVASEVARKAKCKLMLMGAILQTEPNLVVTSQLIDVKTGTTVASQRVEGKSGQAVFAVVDSLTAEIKNDLSLPAGAARERDRPVADVTTSSQEAYRYYLEGMELENKYLFTDAAERYSKAVELDSTFAMALCRLGWVSGGREGRKTLKAAMQYADKVSKRERLHIITRYNLSIHRLDLAREALVQAVDAYPDDKEAWYDLGVVDTELGQIDSGIARLEHVVELDPSWEEIYNRLAYLYDRQAQYDKAIWAVEQNIRLSPNDPNPYDTRGELQAVNGRVKDAKLSYARALEINSDFAFSIEHMGELLALERQYDSALLYFERLISTEGADWHRMGRSYKCILPVLQGHLRKAHDQFCAAETEDVKEGIDVLDKRVWRAVASSGLSADPDSVASCWDSVYSQFGQLYPTWIPSLEYTMGVTYLVEAGGVAQAEEILRTWESREGFVGDHTYAAARACLKFGQRDYAGAASLYDSTIAGISMRTNWSYFFYSYWLGRSWLAAGEHGRAIDVLGGLANLYSGARFTCPLESVKLYYYLGRAYEEAGQHQKAAAQYQEFLRWWREADPEVGLVDDARQRLKSL